MYPLVGHTDMLMCVSTLFQVVTLVIGRWLLGFFISKHDLELLDDPVPDFLYSRCCRAKKSRPAHFDPESNGSTDTFPPSGSTTQSSPSLVHKTSSP